MNQPRSSTGRLRRFGVIWILLAPVIYMMAAISTVKSDTTYHIQLMAFSIVAITALVAGVAAVLRQRWAAIALLALLSLAVLYFVGCSIAIVVMAELPDSTVTATPLIVVLIALVVGIPGLPFLAMAQRLRQLVFEQKPRA